MSYPDTAELWRASGARVDIMPANGKTWELEELQDYVGGLIETVSIDGGQMIVNEEGLLKGLPVNADATERVDALHLGLSIVGDVVLSPEGMLT